MPTPPLWAPWRIEYILGAKPAGCFLCAGAVDEPSEGNLVLWRGERCFVLLNRYPYGSGHVMVAPLEHTGDLAALDPATNAACAAAVQRTVQILGEVMGPDGFNVGLNLGEAAGAGVPGHLHFHVLPRWTADTNFMPLLADVRVIPEHLVATWRKLRPAFDGALEDDR